MKVEVIEVEKTLSFKKYTNLNNFKITTGILGKYKIVISDSGVGKVASSSNSTT